MTNIKHIAPIALSEHIVLFAAEQIDSLADNTRLSYMTALARLARHGVVASADLVDDTLSRAIRSMHKDGYSAGTVYVTIAAARWVARVLDRADPFGPLSRASRRIAARQAPPQKRAVPLVWEEADLAVQIAAADGTRAGSRDAALIAVMSDGLLRGSETAALLWSDLEMDLDGSATVLVRRSKTDQEGHGSRQYLGASTVALIVLWARACGFDEPPDGEVPIFCRVRRGDHIELCTALSAAAVSRIVSRRAAAAGVLGATSRSLRVGSAMSLARAGASLVDLQQVGRWKSPQMPAVYIRGELARRGAVARYRYGAG
ncbi:MAG: tyrosine-type recombinase/integrase [Acidimicrobiaceae bacterium]|nr:tyrosine-type recombinase/integrase [Acidimicrobiaceae bacterium]